MKPLSLDEISVLEALVEGGGFPTREQLRRLVFTVRRVLAERAIEGASGNSPSGPEGGHPMGSGEHGDTRNPNHQEVEIFTDGACRGNPGPGGWAAILRCGNRAKEISGADPATTNNRMELTAVIEALKRVKKPSRVHVCSDSQYMKNGITKWIHTWKRNGWRTSSKKPVKNRELWEELDRLVRKHRVTWTWVRGHTGHPENERCDRLAREAMVRCLKGDYS